MGGLNILVVEDEREVREILREYLTQRGHQVTAVSSGRQALDLLEVGSIRFQVAVVDWLLPGIAGRDVIDALRLERPETAIVVSTGELGSNLDHHADHGFVAYKPYSLRDLHDLIEAAATGVSSNSSKA